nr:RNA-directed DNA polymerase, eukaryota [Tanacetum cinerariifolium]
MRNENENQNFEFSFSPQIPIVSSFLERARSINLTSIIPTIITKTILTPHENPKYTSLSPLSQSIFSVCSYDSQPDSPRYPSSKKPTSTPPSILGRLKSIDFSNIYGDSQKNTNSPGQLARVSSVKFNIPATTTLTKKRKTKVKVSSLVLKKTRSEVKSESSHHENEVAILQRPQTARARMNADDDAKAENFITKFREQLKVQRMDSLDRYRFGNGVLVGGNCATSQAWEDSIGKLKARLSNWKLKTLSVGGRLTLLKSVLGSTPIYNMSIYKAPKSVLHSMESLRRNFFNGAQCNERKIAWIKWTTILASKKNGGLGVSSLYALNRALLFKWVWRFISRDNFLLCRLIMSIHGSKLSSSSSFRGGAETSQLSLIQEFTEGTILSSLEDRWVWDLNGEGVFCVKDVQNLLDDVFLPKAPIATRWIKRVPIKIIVFAWKVHLDRLPTRVNLHHRGVLVLDTSCPICHAEEEDAAHMSSFRLKFPVKMAFSMTLCRVLSIGVVLDVKTARARMNVDDNAKAENFITKFREQLKLQRMDSLDMYNDMLRRP